MGLWSSLIGINTVEITSASPGDMLTAVNDRGIILFDICLIDDLHVRGKVYQYAQKQLQNCLTQRGDSVKIIERQGLYWSVCNLRHRPILIIGLTLLLIMAISLPTRIFFVRVEGNQTIPTQRIIGKAELCGIGFGASRREVRSEKMKNALLSAIPELQWAGVNTAGCVAIISVRERSVANTEMKLSGVSSIVAARDGIIKELTVLQGNPLCVVGQAVKRGQVLVSGYTDCGLLIKATASAAEITAQTQHKLQAVTLTKHIVRSEQIGEEQLHRLRIGKNIINLCKDSGISDTSCVKMYEEKFLTLPGGFQLPVAIITERRIYFDHKQSNDSKTCDYSWMMDDSDAYLRSQMLAGEIIESNRTSQSQEGIYVLDSRYSCVEMIGIVRNEEIVEENGKRD